MHAAKDLEAMRKRKISHVLICHPEIPECYPNDFEYGRAPLLDLPSANLLEHLPDALEFLCQARKGGHSVFVYCAKGISRSSSIVIALLMLERGISFTEAWDVCEQRRPLVYPNVGFQEQLRFLETLLCNIDSSAPLEERLRQLRLRVPRGSLDDQGSPLQIGDAIGASMSAKLGEVDALVERCHSEPNLIAQGAQWTRLTNFFENVRSYKVIPSDSALLRRTQAVAEALRRHAPALLSHGDAPASSGSAPRLTELRQAMDEWVELAGPSLGQGRAMLGVAYDSSSENEEDELETATAKRQRQT